MMKSKIESKQDMRSYWKYFLYILKHKYYVAIECFKTGQFLHALTHDLSKFLPSESFPYAIKFYGGDYTFKFFEVESAFDKAWLLHQHRNKHHWDFWVTSKGIAIPMPEKYVRQMIADWRAMGRIKGDTAREYYIKNRDNMKLHIDTKLEIEAFMY